MKKRLLFSLLLFCAIQIMARPKKKKPNIILIYADDMGRGLLSCYGQSIITTPNIDRLANNGIRFTNAYGCMFCAPARASLITGLHDCHEDSWTITNGNLYTKISTGKAIQEEIETTLDNSGRQAKPQEVFLGQVAKKAGYNTAQFGKLEWGFSTTNKRLRRHGWDYHFGYYDHVRCHGFYPSFLFENGEKVMIPGNTRTDCGKNPEGDTSATLKARRDTTGRKAYSQNLVMDKLLNYIREEKDSSFFIYFPTQLPHGPVAIPEIHPEVKDIPQLTTLEKEYASMVKMLDDDIGRIMKELKDLGIDKNTLILFTADNGHEIYYSSKGRCTKNNTNVHTGERFDNIHSKYYSELAGDIFDGNNGMAGIKRSNWEGGVRVPLIAFWPGKIKEGQVSDQLVANYDLLPTLAEIGGTPAPEGKDGVSFWSTLRGKSSKKKDHNYVVYSSFMGAALVTSDGWKIRHYAPKDVFQLYYLPEDYREEKDLLKDHPEKLKELKTLLEKECDGNLLNGWFRSRQDIIQVNIP